jgi:hypothetical protein
MLNKEQYLLTLIQEECAEVSQRASKAIRFGLYEIQPGQELNNWERLRQEFVDLWTVMTLLDRDLVNFDFDNDDVTAKINKIKKYSQISKDRGILGE